MSIGCNRKLELFEFQIKLSLSFKIYTIIVFNTYASPSLELLNDDGKQALICGESLTKIIIPIAKAIKTEANIGRLDDEYKELKNSLSRLDNYLEPIATYSNTIEKEDGIVLLLKEFNKQCRHIPQKLGIINKNDPSEKYHGNGNYDPVATCKLLRENILLLGNSHHPTSTIIYIDSALNCLNLMVSYYNNNFIRYLDGDLLTSVNQVTTTLTFLLERLLSYDNFNELTTKIL